MRIENGNDCLVGCYALLDSMDSGSSDCYTTGEPGSAQYERDLQRCIRGD